CTAFDSIGRVKSRTDPDGKISTITYEPSTGQAFTITETNSLGHRQIQEVEPGRGVGTRTTDANDRVSTAEYDALGRLIKAWGPGRAAPATPDFQATYTIPRRVPDEPAQPSSVTTLTRGHDNRVETSVTIYDGLGRERQTQEQATGGGRLITDTLYNSSGEVWQTNNAYYTKGDPAGRLFTPLADTAIPNSTRYTYDGLGRVTEELPVLSGANAPGRATRYEYGFTHSTVINPAGAASYRIHTDALGRTSRVDTFTNASRTEFTSMRYEYDAFGRLSKAGHSEAGSQAWTWGYDQRGRMVTAKDPDTGETTTAYDHRDRVASTRNARGVTVANESDQLSRPVRQRLNDGNGPVLSEYTYDSAPGGKGLPATATRFTDGLPYTQSVGGYTNDYQPTATTLTLPQAVATAWGLKASYTYGYSYTDTGLMESATLPGIGNLPAEKLLVRYTKDGLPLSVSGKDWYGAETVYSPHGQVLRSTLGAQPYRVWALAEYDDASGALTNQQVYREQKGDTSLTGGVLVSHRSYGYDDAGNVTAIRERSPGIEERQCFTYDPLGQLKKAWTGKDQETCAAAPAGAGDVAAGKDN
ncbi:MAG TPA: sugar-binding protein, partial [Actinoplanes sp.]